MKIQSFLFCDDVRFELNQKIILVGIYDAGILIPPKTKFPTILPTLGFFCRLQLDHEDRPFDEVEYRFLLDDKDLGGGRGRVSVKDFLKPITITRTVPGLVLPEVGDLKLGLTFRQKGEIVSKTIAGSITVSVMA